MRLGSTFLPAFQERGLALLTDILNPEWIVIGGIFMRCEELLRPRMEAELKEALPHALEKLSVLPAATGERVGDYAGTMAALYALGVADEDLYIALEAVPTA